MHVMLIEDVESQTPLRCECASEGCVCPVMDWASFLGAISTSAAPLETESKNLLHNDCS